VKQIKNICKYSTHKNTYILKTKPALEVLYMEHIPNAVFTTRKNRQSTF